MTVAEQILAGFGDIFRAPFEAPSSLWILVPLFVIWFILVIYFDIHKSEKLGWNTALGNALTLCWIVLDLMRHLFTLDVEDFWFRFLVLFVVLLYAVFIMFISFAHKAREKLTFALAGPTVIYYVAMIAVMWGYGALELTRWVFLDLLILFIIITIFVWILRMILPQAKEDIGGDLGGGMDFGKDLGGGAGGMGGMGGGMDFGPPPGGGAGGMGGMGGGGGLPPMPKL